MDRANYSPQMTKYLVEQKILSHDFFCLVDVGASGGIDSLWNIFGPFIKAIGFEPLIAECERLNGDKKKSPNIEYLPYFITADEPKVKASSGSGYASEIFRRSSCVRATEIQNINYVKEQFNSGSDVVYSNQTASLDQFFTSSTIDTIDFIKIDTDGHDFEVLHGAQTILQSKQVLGLMVESQFHGESPEYSNTFRNIDRLLTGAGFTLFNIETYRYTKRALPGQFQYQIPAQTKKGQVLWGDALYFRDLAGSNPSGIQIQLSPLKIIKLACLFELFDLEDCAAELLITHQKTLASLIDIPMCLNLLTKNINASLTYEQYIHSFENNINSFYPSTSTVQSIQSAVENYTTKEIFLKLLKKIAASFRSS